MKNLKLIIGIALILLLILLIAACTKTKDPVIPDNPNPSDLTGQDLSEPTCKIDGAEMKLSEAESLVENSECGKKGTFKDAYCKEDIGTWWVELNLNEEGKKKCYPACVVYIANKRVKINWRCTGLIVPKA